LRIPLNAELKILLQASYISRRQYRSLLKRDIASHEELKQILIGENYIDPPDWNEAQELLSGKERDERAPETRNPIMKRLMETALKIAVSDSTILILGESGVGKSRLARLIHQHSARSFAPFVTVSCGSIPETLLESELFGVEKGAYTGAVRSREGRFSRADGGTIFLDEVGELTPALQVKLLRVIQEKKIEPLGSDRELDVNVRVVAATNRDLLEDVRSGSFRKDLYFRLNVVPLVIPPLRERTEDILPLADFFVDRISSRGKVRYRITTDAIKTKLLHYSWPGNIRELENCLERMCILSEDGKLAEKDLPERVEEELKHNRSSKSPLLSPSNPNRSLEDVEKNHIEAVLAFTRGNLQKASEILEIHRNTLKRKLDQLGIDIKKLKKKRP